MSTERKNIVVIGLGLAAIALARELEKKLPDTHRMLIITESDAGWEEKVTAPAVDLFPADSPHVVLASTKVIELYDDHVMVDRIHEGFGREIVFEYAVLATGVNYNNAFQPVRGMQRADITAALVEGQRGIEKATSVLIAGGGPTGIELAGEITALHPGKKVTLVTAAAHFTPGEFSPKLGETIKAQLDTAGVAVYFNTRLNTGRHVTGPIPLTSFPLPNGEGAVEADFLIVAYGGKPNSELVDGLDSSAVDKAGFVSVDLATLQVAGHPTLFAMGDVAATPDLKTVLATRSHAATIAANLLSLLAGRQPTKGWAPPMKAIVMAFGPTGGAGQLPLPWFNVIGPWLSAKIKSQTMLVHKFQAEFAH